MYKKLKKVLIVPMKHISTAELYVHRLQITSLCSKCCLKRGNNDELASCAIHDQSAHSYMTFIHEWKKNDGSKSEKVHTILIVYVSDKASEFDLIIYYKLRKNFSISLHWAMVGSSFREEKVVTTLFIRPFISSSDGVQWMSLHGLH